MGSDEVKVTERMWSHQSWVWIYEPRQQVVKRGADGGPQSIRLILDAAGLYLFKAVPRRILSPPK